MRVNQNIAAAVGIGQWRNATSFSLVLSFSHAHGSFFATLLLLLCHSPPPSDNPTSFVFPLTTARSQELGSKVAAASRAVHQFRTRLDATKGHVRMAYINMLRLLVQRQNQHRLLGLLDTIATVSKTQSTIQYLLAGGEYNRALNLIHTTQEVVTADLQGVHAVRHLAHQLNEIKSLIAKMVDGDLVQMLTENVKAGEPCYCAKESTCEENTACACSASSE